MYSPSTECPPHYTLHTTEIKVSPHSLDVHDVMSAEARGGGGGGGGEEGRGRRGGGRRRGGEEGRRRGGEGEGM